MRDEEDGRINESFPDEHLFAIHEKPPWYADIVNYLATGTFPQNYTPAQRHRLKHDSRFYLWDDPYLWKIGADQILRRCIPDHEIESVLKFCHEHACGGHFGPRRTSRKILDSGFYWPHVFRDSYAHCQKCDRCQRTGNISARNEMPQMPIHVDEIFDMWGIDFMGPFPPSFGFEYILVAVDYVSKWVKRRLTRHDDAKTVIDFLRTNIFCRHGVPKALISDQGSHFCNRFSRTDIEELWSSSIRHPLRTTHKQTAKLRYLTGKSRESWKRWYDLRVRIGAYGWKTHCGHTEQHSKHLSELRLTAWCMERHAIYQ